MFCRVLRMMSAVRKDSGREILLHMSEGREMSKHVEEQDYLIHVRKQSSKLLCVCLWPVGAVVQRPLQPLDRRGLQRVGHQRHEMPGQAAAALRTHGVPLVGHGTGTWGRAAHLHSDIRFTLPPSLQRNEYFGFWMWSNCMNIPICSFSKGSSISFRLASRRMSVQIYRQTDQRWALTS